MINRPFSTGGRSGLQPGQLTTCTLLQQSQTFFKCCSTKKGPVIRLLEKYDILKEPVVHVQFQYKSKHPIVLQVCTDNPYHGYSCIPMSIIDTRFCTICSTAWWFLVVFCCYPKTSFNTNFPRGGSSIKKNRNKIPSIHYLDSSTVHRRATYRDKQPVTLTFLPIVIRVCDQPTPLMSKSLDCGRKLEYRVEKTHAQLDQQSGN